MRRKYPYANFYYIILFILCLFPFDGVTGQERTDSITNFTKCWQTPSENLSGTLIASDNDLIYTTTVPNTIQALNASNGSGIWASTLKGRIFGKILVGGGNLVVINEVETNEAMESRNLDRDSPGRSLTAVNLVSGLTGWTKPISGEGEVFLYGFGDFFIGVYQSGVVNLISFENGKLLREIDLKQGISAAGYSDGVLALGTLDKKLHFFSVPGSEFINLISVEEIPVKIFVADGKNVLWADKRGVLRRLDLVQKKTIWKRRFGGEISSIVNSPNGVLVSSLDNFVYLFDIDSGKIKWKRRFSGRIVEEPVVAREFAAVFAYGDLSSFVMSLETGEVVDILTLSDGNYFTGKPVFAGDLMIFPTLNALVAFGVGDCRANKKTDK